eukprot:11153541-Alexandrium_andersonii.AAC.1
MLSCTRTQAAVRRSELELRAQVPDGAPVTPPHGSRADGPTQSQALSTRPRALLPRASVKAGSDARVRRRESAQHRGRTHPEGGKRMPFPQEPKGPDGRRPDRP